MARTRTAVVEREIAQPAEKIWRALTQPHLIEEWLMKSDFKPVEGHRFTLRNQPKPDVNVVIECEVLEIEPLKTLSYTWQAFGTDTIVTFTLTPTNTGTLLRVEQSGFGPDQELAYRGAKAAWKQFLKALEQVSARPD
jgi:uncharacterized protein YndB with AHSA1/START domain